jgi:1-acyl-sn-glycerol-3-phosphate acyltransferase
MDRRRAPRNLMLIQWLLGLGVHLFMSVPFLRRIHGAERLRAQTPYLFVCNHVSLLDTILLGAIAWRARTIPISVLGDKSVWHASWIKRVLSSKIGFLVERGKLNPRRIEELKAFARTSHTANLIVFPEGTRGDGVHVAECQQGIYFIAQEARIQIVPIFIENMQLVSTKNGRFHPIGGWRKVEVHFGKPIPPEEYLNLPRDEFLEFIRGSIVAAKSGQPARHLSPAQPFA